MNASTALMRRIDPNEPLLDATAMLRSAHAIIAQTAPVVRAAGSRFARRFRRSPVAESTFMPTTNNAGATRYYNRHASSVFSLSSGRAVSPARDTRMASRFLMAGASPRQRPATPSVSLLQVLQARTQAFALMGRLTNRFNLNRSDMADGKPDMARTFRYQARYGSPQMAMEM